MFLFIFLLYPCLWMPCSDLSAVMKTVQWNSPWLHLVSRPRRLELSNELCHNVGSGIKFIS
jgi:hypothetical protein